MDDNYDIQYWSSRPDRDDYWTPYLKRDDSHQTSRDLLKALQPLDLPVDARCHEMGANAGRNLHYIESVYPLWRLSANDVNPHAPGKLARAYPQLKVAYTVVSSEEWVESTAPVDVVLSVSHFIHIEDLSPFVEWLPRKVKRYLVLRESAGLNGPDTPYWQYWTTRREKEEKSRWFDHDLAQVFKGTSLELIDRFIQFTYWDAVFTPSVQRQYDIYVFKQTAEVGT